MRVWGRGTEAAGLGEGAQTCTFYSQFLPSRILTTTQAKMPFKTTAAYGDTFLQA
jgi:hypothetical protein